MVEGLEGPMLSETSKRYLLNPNISLSLISFDLNKKLRLQPAEVEGPPPPDCCAIRDTWKYQVHRKFFKYSKIFRDFSGGKSLQKICLFSFDSAVKTGLVFAWTIDPFPQAQSPNNQFHFHNLSTEKAFADFTHLGKTSRDLRQS